MHRIFFIHKVHCKYNNVHIIVACWYPICSMEDWETCLSSSCMRCAWFHFNLKSVNSLFGQTHLLYDVSRQKAFLESSSSAIEIARATSTSTTTNILLLFKCGSLCSVLENSIVVYEATSSSIPSIHWFFWMTICSANRSGSLILLSATTAVYVGMYICKTSC